MDLFDRANDVLNDGADEFQQIIYDLDSYFQNLETLMSNDRSFLKLPLDEPYFEIVDDAKSGRRVIKIPADFQKNGVSVQGDESAEMVFFSIDRYYDSFDLMGPTDYDIAHNSKTPVHVIIQWETKNRKGISLAFLDEHNRPFIDKAADKLYFGWPISSEITEDAGEVKFNVRFYQFSGQNDAEGKPILSFGLNTQTAKVKINSALNFTITANNNGMADFEDDVEQILNRNDLIVARVQNSSKTGATLTEEDYAKIPVFLQNVLSDLTVDPTQGPVYSVITAENSAGEEETYYEMDLTEFDLDPRGYLTLQALAVPSEGYGLITYSGRKKDAPNGVAYTIGAGTDANDSDTLFVKVAELANEDFRTKRQDGCRYFEKTIVENSPTYVKATPHAEVGEVWAEEDYDVVLDGNNEEVSREVKYYLPLSKEYYAQGPGYYYIVATNTQGITIPKSLDSYKIWIPAATQLTADNIVGGLNTVDTPQAAFLNEGNVSLTLELNQGNKPAHNDFVYEWKINSEDPEIVLASTTNTYETPQGAAINENDRPRYDEVYSVACHTKRNRSETTDVVKFFRVTDKPHAFTFRTDYDIDIDPLGTQTLGNKRWRNLEENETVPTVHFSDDDVITINETKEFAFVSDTIQYRWRMAAIRGDNEAATPDGVYANDTAAPNYSYNDDPDAWTPLTIKAVDEHGVISYEVPTISYTPNANEINSIGNYYYCELINVANGDTKKANNETVIARTEYIYVV